MASRIIGKIDVNRYDFSRDINYLNGIEKADEEYDEFAQGYWKNLSLINSTGDERDTQYRNSDSAVATAHLDKCSEVSRFLSDTFDMSRVRMVRARNLIDGMVIPHRDFVELDARVNYFRVFVPLELNTDAYHSDESGVFQMMPGEVWFLDARMKHAAVNFADRSRMFLCLDFIFEGEFREFDIFAQGADVADERRTVLVEREPLDESMFSDMLAATAVRLSKGYLRESVFDCSRYHFRYDVPVAACYDWLIRAAVAANDHAIHAKTIALKRFLVDSREMDERFSF